MSKINRKLSALLLTLAIGWCGSVFAIDAARIGACSWSWQKPLKEVATEMTAANIHGIHLALGPFLHADGRHGDAEDAATLALVKAKIASGEWKLMSTMIGTIGEDYTTLETIRKTGGIVPDATWEENRKLVTAGAKLTRELGGTYMSLHAGFLDESDPKAFAKYVERVSWMRDEARQYGVTVILESGQETAEDLRKFMEKVPGIGINFDPANMILYAKGDPREAVKILLPWIKQVHVKDACLTKTPGTWGTETPWGEGEVGGADFITTLENLGYRGNYVIEREGGETRAQDIRLAAKRLAVATAGAQFVNLWPAGKMPDAQPHQVALPLDKTKDAGFRAGQRDQPYLEWCPPPDAKKRCGVALILISGGAYENWCDIPLIVEWEKRFTELGIQCVKLVYRTPRPKNLPIHQTAWEDGQRAVRLVRREAAVRGFDPEKIGAVSMSAGSHLAVLLGTSALTPAYAPIDEIDRIPCHLNFALPNATAYALTDGIGILNTTGGNGPDVQLDSIFKFDEKTCPMCLTHGGADPVSPIASTFIYRKLREKKIPSEVHLYPDKPHGAFGLDRQIEFLRQMGILGPVAPQVDVMARFPHDDDRGEYLAANLWPEGKMPDVRTNQCLPYLEWHCPKTLKTRAIQIIYSGGAYWGNDPNGFEVAPVRRYLNAQGMTVVTMRYRTPRPAGLEKHQTAWEDLQRVIRLVRAEAPKRGLDPNRIGIMGSSAGGHLTLMGVTSSSKQAYAPIDEIDKIPCNANWAIAIYPAYSLTDGVDVENTERGNPDSAVLVPEFAFDDKVCPVLFIHGDADGWAAMNSVKTWECLRRMGVQGEVHTLATRFHCFQAFASPGTGSYTWIDRIWEFLTDKGFNR